MSTLKDRFENYSVQPDPKVWLNISNTIARHRVVRRRLVTTTCVVAVAGIAAVAFMLNNGKSDVNGMQVAKNTPVSETTVATVLNSQPETVAVNEVGDITPVVREETRTVSSNDSPNAEQVKAVSAEQELQKPLAEVKNEQGREEVAANNVVPPVSAKTNSSSVSVVSEMPEAKMSDEPSTVTADDNGSASKIQQRIDPKVSTSELVVWIPNAFSPDDPVEESARVFKVTPNTSASILSYEIYIYSRTGRLVYHSKDYNQGWDGRANGQTQPMGTYVYIIEINDAVKGLQHKKGTITLLR